MEMQRNSRLHRDAPGAGSVLGCSIPEPKRCSWFGPFAGFLMVHHSGGLLRRRAPVSVETTVAT
jgi:hypothetical protein